MHILIIEDEVRLAESIGQLLEDHQMSVDMVHDGQLGLDYGLSGHYDVIILDVMLPKKNGFEVISDLRGHKIDTPVIFLTAKDTIEDKIRGLNLGADDYLTKPFASEELLARIHAISRRKGEIVLDELHFADLVLNLDNHSLATSTKSVHLSVKEFELAQLLMTYPQQIFSKTQIISRIWGLDSDVDENNVEAYISFLRKKFQYLNSKATIKTVRKVGYHLGVTR